MSMRTTLANVNIILKPKKRNTAAGAAGSAPSTCAKPSTELPKSGNTRFRFACLDSGHCTCDSAHVSIEPSANWPACSHPYWSDRNQKYSKQLRSTVAASVPNAKHKSTTATEPTRLIDPRHAEHRSVGWNLDGKGSQARIFLDGGVQTHMRISQRDPHSRLSALCRTCVLLGGRGERESSFLSLSGCFFFFFVCVCFCWLTWIGGDVKPWDFHRQS
jgi:hypothetical protein